MINIHKHTYAAITTVLIAAVVFMGSCATQKSAAKKADAARTERQIADSLQSHTIKVIFDYVNTMRFGPHYLTTEYSIRLHGDTIESYLPYFGRAYRANLANNDKSPLSFKGSVKSFDARQGKKGRYTISFQTANNTETLEYTLTVFPNGQTLLNINSSDREPINFEGEMDLK